MDNQANLEMVFQSFYDGFITADQLDAILNPIAPEIIDRIIIESPKLTKGDNNG